MDRSLSVPEHGDLQPPAEPGVVFLVARFDTAGAYGPQLKPRRCSAISKLGIDANETKVGNDTNAANDDNYANDAKYGNDLNDAKRRQGRERRRRQ
jgi:hypothetical protein